MARIRLNLKNLTVTLRERCEGTVVPLDHLPCHRVEPFAFSVNGWRWMNQLEW